MTLLALPSRLDSASLANSWGVQQVAGQVHVWPIADLRAHDDTPGCWCGPLQDVEEPAVWTHNALDRRDTVRVQ